MSADGLRLVQSRQCRTRGSAGWRYATDGVLRPSAARLPEEQASTAYGAGLLGNEGGGVGPGGDPDGGEGTGGTAGGAVNTHSMSTASHT